MKETEEFRKNIKEPSQIFTIRADLSNGASRHTMADKQNEGIKDPEVIGDPV